MCTSLCKQGNNSNQTGFPLLSILNLFNIQYTRTSKKCSFLFHWYCVVFFCSSLTGVLKRTSGFCFLRLLTVSFFSARIGPQSYRISWYDPLSTTCVKILHSYWTRFPAQYCASASIIRVACKTVPRFRDWTYSDYRNQFYGPQDIFGVSY